MHSMDKESNHKKNVAHGFFLSVGTTIAEPSTILPLMISYFGGSSILIGLFASMLRGSALFVQFFAAFKAQNYPKMLPFLRIVFLIRFLAWFFIGVGIYIFGEDNPELTLWCIGLGLFFFSFSAGFGAIYFKEIIAKIFSYKFRGKTMAARQFFTALGAIISGAVAGVVLNSFEAPYSFAYLFMLSAILMGVGYSAFATVDEPIKEDDFKVHNTFSEFMHNALKILKEDSDLKIQVTTYFLAYSYLLSLPFIILDAKESITLDATAIALLITTQMVGAMVSNFLWAKLSGKGKNRLVTLIALSMYIVAISSAYFASSLMVYMIIFFLIGGAMDGNRIASGNLIIKIAPAPERGTYLALQTNIISFGMFFSIIGGLILSVSSYTFLYSVTLLFLALALFFALKLRD